MQWKLMFFVFGIASVIVLGGAIYYQSNNPIIKVEDKGVQTIEGKSLQGLSANKPSGYIGESGTTWSFDIKEDTKQEVEIDIDVINSSLIEITLTEHPDSTTGNGYKWDMALCTTGSNLRYLNEDAQGGFDNAIPIEPIYGNLTNFGLNKTWCGGEEGYMLFSSGSKNQFPKKIRLLVNDLEEFKLLAGTGTVEIDGLAGAFATAFFGENICRDSSGVLHVGYVGADSDLWYGNSTDDGVTWSTKEIHTNAAGVDITCGITNNITIVFDNGVDIDGFESGDNGETFGSIFSVFDHATLSMGAVHCAVDSEDVVHCVGSEISSDFMYYTNSTTWDSGKFLLGGQSPGDDTDQAQIEVSPLNDNIFIIGAGSVQDDIDIWSSIDDFTTRNPIHNSPGNIADGPNNVPGISIDTIGNIYFTIAASSDLWFCIGSVITWDGGTGAWSCQEIDSLESRGADIGVSLVGDLFILYEDDNTDATTDIVRANTTDAFVTTEEIRQNIIPASATQPSIASSFLPTENRPDEVLRFVFANASGIFYDEFAIDFAAGASCTCPGADENWEIDHSDSCNIVAPCDLTSGNLSFINSGTTICDATIDTHNMTGLGTGILNINSGCLINVG